MQNAINLIFGVHYLYSTPKEYFWGNIVTTFYVHFLNILEMNRWLAHVESTETVVEYLHTFELLWHSGLKLKKKNSERLNQAFKVLNSADSKNCLRFFVFSPIVYLG